MPQYPPGILTPPTASTPANIKNNSVILQICPYFPEEKKKKGVSSLIVWKIEARTNISSFFQYHAVPTYFHNLQNMDVK